MTYVADASVLVSALTDDGEDGRWALDVLEAAPLAAPHLALVEATNILRRLELASELSREMAALAHASLVDLPIELYPYPPFAERIWSLRATITAYDAWYVAVAENLGAELATLDARLARTSGPTCRFVLPPPTDDDRPR